MEERKLTQHWINAIQNILECAFENLLGLTIYVRNNPEVLQKKTVEGTIRLFATGSIIESCLIFIKKAQILVDESFTEDQKARIIRMSPEVVFISSEEEKNRLEEIGKDFVIKYLNGKITPNDMTSSALSYKHLYLESQRELNNSNKELEAQLKINKALENTISDLEGDLEYQAEELLEVKSQLRAKDEVINAKEEATKDLRIQQRLDAQKIKDLQEALKSFSDEKTRSNRNTPTQAQVATLLGVSQSTVSRNARTPKNGYYLL